MKLTGQQCKDIALDMIKRSSEAITIAELNRAIVAAHPEMTRPDGKPLGTVRGATWKLHVDYPGQVKKGPDGYTWKGKK